jgi:hypothetical protein
MRNKFTVQFTNSKVTHMPIGDLFTACGRAYAGLGIWEGGYYETFPEVTCKSCQKYIPKDVTWNTTTAQYVNAPGRPYGVVPGREGSSFAEIARNEDKSRFTWFPSADGDPSGILVFYMDDWG